MANKIKIAIVGLGNCAKSLLEGIEYYSTSTNDIVPIDGIMQSDIGGYLAKDIECVCAFDIDSRKIGIPISEAIKSKPNCSWSIVDKIDNGILVSSAPVLDGYASLMDSYPEDIRFLVSEDLRNTTDFSRGIAWTDKLDTKWKTQIIEILARSGAQIIVNYLPVGSQKATEFWAEIALQAKIPFLNCIPVFIASDPVWENRFIENRLPLIGDDMRSQFGASVLSQVLQELAFDRGHIVKCHIQRNVGGNTDFLNMEDKSRLQSKKISKENVIRSQNDIRNISTVGSFLHAGPSEFISYFGDNKIANFHIELTGFGNAPVILDAQLSVQDSPNSAGVVIDAIRYLQVAREMKICGALRGPSAFTQKTPPMQMMFSDSKRECDALAARQLTEITKQQVRL